MRARRRWLWLLLALPLAFRSGVAHAQSAIQYVYDELGRLIAVIDANGDSAVYHYDAVGNILSIDRHSASTVAIITFAPSTGPVGTTVTISGTGFSSTPSQNTVTFNGTAASVTSASATQLVVTVPTGATTGAIGVTAPNGSATSSTNFVVAAAPGAPTITSFSPGSGTNGAALAITGTNFDPTAGNDRATLNATLLSLTSATGTQLSTGVPGSAVTSGRVRVATPIGTATSANDFWVAPPGYGTGNLESTVRFSGFGDANAVTSTLTSTSNVGLLLFDGVPLHRASLKFSGATLIGSASVLSPYGIVMASSGITSSGSFIEPVTLSASGTYTYTVLLKATATGHATVTVYDVPDDLTGTLTPTASGASVTPVLGTPGQNARYTFTGVANARVSVKVPAGTDTIALAAVSILRPDGTALATQSFTTSGGFIDAQTLPTDGTYTILVDPNGTNTGNLTLTAYDASDQTDTITTGTPKTVTTSTPGQNVRLSFTGTATHRMSVKVGNGPSGTVSILDRDGATTLGSVTSGATTTLVEPVTLPADGTYTVLVDYSGTNTGSVTLTLYDVPADVTGTLTPTTTGGVATADLSIPGRNALYTLGTPTNTRVSLLVSAGPIGSLTVRRPDGTTLVNGTISTVPTFIDPWTFESGQTIKADPSGANAGSVTLTAYDVPADYSGTVTIGGTATTVTTTVPGQNGTVTFSGTASQQVTVRMTNNHLGLNNGAGLVTVKLLSTDGQTVLATTTSLLSSFNLTSVPLTLPSTGTYTITVDPSSNNKGTIDVAVTNP